jgi:asparagine synthase (glutamine-hydrolysing)
MCGITGSINLESAPDQNRARAAVHAMQLAIAHRGPDDFGIWQDETAPVTLAQRRLAIIDLSPGGHQPMISSSGRYVVVFNGEIYNYRDLRAELERVGYAFKSASDTEVLLTAVETWGLDETLPRLSGMFAVALWDRTEKTVHFFRDRFGKKPLYVGWAGKNLVFASELKSFHAHPDFTPDINRDTLALYMRYGYVCAPHAIFRGVWQILPAGRLSLALNDLRPGEDLSRRMSCFWSLPRVVEQGAAHRARVSEGTAIARFEEKLMSCVQSRMVADVPLGAFLSGGIDSSAVVALMQKQMRAQGGDAVKTFSIGFHEKSYDEAGHAKAVAAHLGTEHREFYVSAEEALNVIPKLPDIYDEPFADSSQIPTYLLSRIARGYVTVALTGDGGDEILGGYQRHTHIPMIWDKIKGIPRPLRRVMSAAGQSVPQGFYDAVRPAYPQFGRRVHRLMRLMGLKDAAAVYDDLVGAWPNAATLVPGASVPLIPLTDPAWQAKHLTFAETMMYGDTLSYRPNDLMVKVDRASMAVALETRAPLMDHTLAEFAWTLPHDLKVRGTAGKWILRQVLKKYVPEALYERPKMGFGVPVNDWLRGSLKDWAGDLLSPDRIKAQGLLDPAIVDRAWQKHRTGINADANATQLWSVLMFQAWYDRWMKG